METVYMIMSLLAILLIIFFYQQIKSMRELSKFRSNINTGDLVFFLDRHKNRYLAATAIKVEYVYPEHTMWRVEIHSEDGDYTLVTSELNLFDKKY